ncbi:hypothetical protein BH23ACT2_BH23ACT2_30830 [soil metagenome]
MLVAGLGPFPGRLTQLLLQRRRHEADPQVEALGAGEDHRQDRQHHRHCQPEADGRPPVGGATDQPVAARHAQGEGRNEGEGQVEAAHLDVSHGPDLTGDGDGGGEGGQAEYEAPS